MPRCYNGFEAQFFFSIEFIPKDGQGNIFNLFVCPPGGNPLASGPRYFPEGYPLVLPRVLPGGYPSHGQGYPHPGQDGCAA